MRKLAIGLGLAMILAACSTGGGATTTSQTSPSTTQAPVTTQPAPDTATLMVTSGALGEFVTDGEGNTLYVFMPDNQSDSTCYDACAANWPALTLAVSAGEGIDAGSLSTTTRTDGSTQVTYNRWPLYYFAGDAKAGDTNGQGLNDVWHVVSPEGEPIS